MSKKNNAYIVNKDRLPDKENPLGKGGLFFSNGSDNQYPTLQRALVRNSVTAKRAVQLMAEAFIGDGVPDVNRIEINTKKQQTFYELAVEVAQEAAAFNMVFVWVGYDEELRTIEHEVLPYECCRIGKTDDEGYSGKIIYSPSAFKKSDDFTEYDVYNPDPIVLEAQIEAAGDFDSFKGQVAVLNLDSLMLYPDARFHAVQHDCDSEFASAYFKNSLLRNGFHGKTIVFTKPLIGPEVEEWTLDENGKQIQSSEFRKANEEREAFIETASNFSGVENIGGVMVMELDTDGEGMDSAIRVEHIKSEIDDKKFEYTDVAIRKNICVAANNLPDLLITPQDNIFGQSGEAFRAARVAYWSNCRIDRGCIEIFISKLFRIGSDVTTPSTGFKFVMPADYYEQKNTNDASAAASVSSDTTDLVRRQAQGADTRRADKRLKTFDWRSAFERIAARLR